MSPTMVFGIFAAAVLAAIVLRRFLPVSPGRNPALAAAVTAAIDTALDEAFPLAVIRVDVKVFDGVAILGGYVREAAQAKLAVEAARATPGVKSVDNRIAVRSEG